MTWIFSPYDDHREVQPFKEICWYFGGIMPIKEKKYQHWPGQMKKQYNHVRQDISRYPPNVPPHATTQVYQAFIDFMIHFIHEVEQVWWRWIHGSIHRDTWSGFIWFLTRSYSHLSHKFKNILYSFLLGFFYFLHESNILSHLKKKKKKTLCI